MKNLVVIENHEDYGVEWILSFSGSNPTLDESIKCVSKDEAFKLKYLIERIKI